MFTISTTNHFFYNYWLEFSAPSFGLNSELVINLLVMGFCDGKDQDVVGCRE